MRTFWLMILSMLLLVTGSFAQEDDPTVTTSFRQAYVFAGPGATYRDVGILNPGVPIKIIERNKVGNWVHVQMYDIDGTVTLDGWIITGFLNYPDELRFSEVPVNPFLPDAETGSVESGALAELYAEPMAGSISPLMRAVLEQGIDAGRDPYLVTKIGDSLIVSDLFLNLMNQTDEVLGPYDTIAAAVDAFTVVDDSIANDIGMASFSVLDPMWAQDEQCQSGETPLDCELRVHQAGIAFVMFGPNDVRSMDEERYGREITTIVETALAVHVVPVLATFSVHPDDELYWQGINFNRELVRISNEYEVPLINLWAAAQILPEYGLDEDDTHMQNSGFNFLKYDSGHEAWYGMSLYNLLALVTLNDLLTMIEDIEGAS
ncbi:MAG: SH3 domain-containing protein [Anaerolineae bacterium]|nr:SH3 domain-containing protein [Anaerolineae bacterium]MCA9893317.1 SH3 domain-containing protein [Anaerolineae bacterium]